MHLGIVGENDGLVVGDDDGLVVGDDVGLVVGDDVGLVVGDDVGLVLGDDVGLVVGNDVGLVLGDDVGRFVSFCVHRSHVLGQLSMTSDFLQNLFFFPLANVPIFLQVLFLPPTGNLPFVFAHVVGVGILVGILVGAVVEVVHILQQFLFTFPTLQLSAKCLHFPLFPSFSPVTLNFFLILTHSSVGDITGDDVRGIFVGGSVHTPHDRGHNLRTFPLLHLSAAAAPEQVHIGFPLLPKLKSSVVSSHNSALVVVIMINNREAHSTMVRSEHFLIMIFS